jgi:hypothetical protein
MHLCCSKGRHNCAGASVILVAAAEKQQPRGSARVHGRQHCQCLVSICLTSVVRGADGVDAMA